MFAVVWRRFVSTKQFEELQRFGARYLVPLLGGYSPFPLGVVFVLTMRCNMRCETCVQSELRQGYVYSPEQELSLPELKATLDDIRHSFLIKPMIHVSGGEPFLHRGAIDFIAYAKEQGFRCSLTTNGFLLEGKAKELVDLGLDRINVSLDGPRTVHDEIRNTPGAFDHALAGIQALERCKRDEGARMPRISINSVITRMSQPYMSEMVEIAHQAGVQGLSFQHLKFADDEPEDVHRLDVEKLLADMPRLARQAGSRLALTFFPPLNPRQARDYYLKPVAELGGYCLMPWFVMRIRLGGEISPCSGYVVDNVRTKRVSLRQVWNSPRYREFRASLARQRIYPTCGRCCHRRYP